MTYKSRCAYLF